MLSAQDNRMHISDVSLKCKNIPMRTTFNAGYILYTGYKSDSRMRLIEDKTCYKDILAVMDAVEIISGKWRIPILAILANKTYRFKELCRELAISPRMLTRELEALEAHGLIIRIPEGKQVVRYALSDYGLTLRNVIAAMKQWGHIHRERLMHQSA